MKKILLLVVLAGCTLQHTMERANELMAQNTVIMEASKAAIEENTQQIKRSTDTMVEFQIVFPILFGLILVGILYIISRFIFKTIKKKRA